MEVTVGKLMDIIKNKGLSRRDLVDIMSSREGFSEPDSVMVMQDCESGRSRLIICHSGNDGQHE